MDVIRIQFHRIQYFRFGVRVFCCRVRARVRVFPESGFSSDLYEVCRLCYVIIPCTCLSLYNACGENKRNILNLFKHRTINMYGHHINLKTIKTSMTLKFVIILQNLIKAYLRKGDKSKYDRKLTDLDVETTRIRSRVFIYISGFKSTNLITPKN